MLERVSAVAAADNLQQGWTDPLLEGWIAQVTTAVREAGQKPLTDETGVGVAALAGWTLSLVGDDYAVLANEADHATIILRANR